MDVSSIVIPFSEGPLHLKRFCGDEKGEVVFMLHGAVENGTIFYSDKGKGLAPYLARLGYDVFVADLRGRGKSLPFIDSNAHYGQTESITIEIPLFLEEIEKCRGGVAQHWIAHSWGGVLLNSYLSRFADDKTNVSSLTYFGSKREVRTKSLRRFFIIDVIWRFYCKSLVKVFGFLPATRFKIGGDNESKKSHRQSVEWVTGPWIDSDDGFDYGVAARKKALPPALYLAGQNDFVLGHQNDVKRFMDESGLGEKRFCLLSKRAGFKHDYDHISMLVHRDCEQDHFKDVHMWLGRMSAKDKAEGQEQYHTLSP